METTTSEEKKIADSTLLHSVIKARAWDGLTILTVDGQPATLAVIDASGHIVESGPEVVDEVWDVTVEAYRRFLIGANALQVVSTPQGMFGEKLLD